MHARLRLDIGWPELLWGLTACVAARGRGRRAERVERLFSERGDALAALSVRSGFDLYLETLALPVGSEVLVSALTIPHMVQLVEAHGLRAVPFAIDPRTLAPVPGELERRATPRTRAVLFAHLFGARAELGPTVELARRRRWLLWEDCAQAFAFDGWRGHPQADLALFSFGLIKTATAIQGGILCVRDADLRERMRARHAAWPVQPRADQARRLTKAALLALLSQPWLFERFARVVARRGRELDHVLHTATRSFPGAAWRTRLRRAPSAALLGLLERRLRRPRASLAAARRAHGETLLAALGEDVDSYGRLARERLHWVFAVGCDEPEALVRALGRAGFDATNRSSLVPVPASGGGEAPPEASRLLERLVYVPLALEASERERAELVRLLRSAAKGYELRPHVAPAPESAPALQRPVGPLGPSA